MSFYGYERKFDDLPLLPADEQKELVRRAHAGDKAARDKMVLCNMKLIVANVKPFLTADLYDDLLHEGVIGLLRAIDGYDPESGYRFSTYATYWIRQVVCVWLFRQNRMHLSRLDHDALQRLKKYQVRGIADRDEIMRKAKLKADQYEVLIRYQQAAFVSLEESISPDYDEPLLNLLPDETSEDGYFEVEEQDEQDSKREQVAQLLAALPERQREIVEMAFGIDRKCLSQVEIARIEQISSSRVQQILNAALLKLRIAAIGRAS